MLDASHWPGIPLHLSIDRDVSSRDKSKQIKIRFKENGKGWGGKIHFGMSFGNLGL